MTAFSVCGSITPARLKKIMNDIIEEKVKYTRLFDFYGELLKPQVREMFSDYFMNDLSLSEVAENLGISRQAVHEQLKRCEKKLDEYEEALHLSDRYFYIAEQLEKVKEIAASKKIDEITKITEEILLNGF